MRIDKLAQWAPKDTTVVLIWPVFCFLAFSYHLGEPPPYHTDESFYIESVKNMVDSGDFLTPVYHGQPRFAKPVLIYWLMSVPWKLLGFSLFNARLVSTLFATLSIWVLYFLARRLFNPRVALLSLFILPGLYIHFLVARWATTDMTLTFFILLSIFFWVRGYQQKSEGGGNYYLAYLSMALGFLTKGPPAIIIPCLAIGGFLLISGQRDRFATLRPLAGLAILLAVNLPWFFTMLYLHGDAFKNHLLGPELKDRILHGLPFSFYYFGVSVRYYLPWSLFFIAALAIHSGWVSPSSAEKTRPWKERVLSRLRWLRGEEGHAVLFCLVWFFGTLLLFTVFRIEHSRYMLPASPAMVMIVAHFFDRLRTRSDYRSSLFKIPFFLTLAIYVVAALVLGTASFAFASFFPLPGSSMVLPPFLLLGTGFLIALYVYRPGNRLATHLAVLQLVFMASLNGDAVPYFNQYPMRTTAQILIKNSWGDEPVAVFRLDNQRAKLEVRTAHKVLAINDPENLRRFIESEKRVFVVARESDWKKELAQEGLRRIGGDRLWKKTRRGKEILWSVRKQGLEKTLEAYRENLVLLVRG